MNTAKEYFDYFKQELIELTDEEFVSRFNREVGIKAFGVARQGYLWAIRNEFERRNIDYSDIGSSDSISYKNAVYLKNKKLHILNDTKIETREEEYTELKNEIFGKWENLITDMEKLLEKARQRGGTLGYRVGSIKNKQIDLLKFAKNYW